MFNRKWIFLALVAAAAIAPALHVRADATADARKAIQSQYDRANAAFAKKDLKGAFATYTTDRTETGQKGEKQTLAQVKQTASQLLSVATSFSLTTVVQSISVKGGSASVGVKEHVKIIMPNPQTNKPSILIDDSVNDDVWVKVGANWLEKSSVEKSGKMTADGKEISP